MLIVCLYVCVRACVHACVRVCACVCVRACSAPALEHEEESLANEHSVMREEGQQDRSISPCPQPAFEPLSDLGGRFMRIWEQHDQTLH